MKLVWGLVKLLVLAAVITAIVLGVQKKLERHDDKSAIQYREIPVKRGDIHVRALSTGTVQPENRLEIKPPVAGRIEQINVDEGALIHTGDVLATMSSTERAAMIDAARSQGAAEVKRWSDYYRATQIIAPIDGMLILRNIEPGQTVTTQDAVLVLSDRLIIQAQVDETDIARVTLNQQATVTLDAYSEDNIPAHVLKIAYEAKTVNNVTTYFVDVLPDRIPDYMRSGMTASVAFTIKDRNAVLTLPTYALDQSEGHPSVLRGDPKNPEKRTRVAVQVGESDGEKTEVVSGLNENDTVLAPALGEKREADSNPFTVMRGPSSTPRR